MLVSVDADPKLIPAVRPEYDGHILHSYHWQWIRWWYLSNTFMASLLLFHLSPINSNFEFHFIGGSAWACAHSYTHTHKGWSEASTRHSFAWKRRPIFKLMAAVLLMDEKHREMRIPMATHISHTHTHTLTDPCSAKPAAKLRVDEFDWEVFTCREQCTGWKKAQRP